MLPLTLGASVDPDDADRRRILAHASRWVRQAAPALQPMSHAEVSLRSVAGPGADAAVARAREAYATMGLTLADAYDAERQRLLAGGPGVVPGEWLAVLGQAHEVSPRGGREVPVPGDSGLGPAPGRGRRGLAGLGLGLARIPLDSGGPTNALHTAQVHPDRIASIVPPSPTRRLRGLPADYDPATDPPLGSTVW